MGEDSDLKITISKSQIEKIKKFLDYKYIILFLFIITTILYLNINGLPLTHPGNIKAADPFTHAVLSEQIIDSQQWNYYTGLYGLNREKEVNPQPPLYYTNAAILTIFSNVPAWITIFFLVCISQAFFVIIVYLITNEIFNNDKIATVAAVLTMVPLPLQIWLYGVYIGLWLQVPAYFFIMSFLWLFIKYMKTKETWTLFFLGLCISSVALLHAADLILMFLPSAIIALDIFLRFVKEKKFWEFVKQGITYVLTPLITLFILLPRFLFVWGGSFAGGWYDLGFYGFSDLDSEKKIFIILYFSS